MLGPLSVFQILRGGRGIVFSWLTLSLLLLLRVNLVSNTVCQLSFGDIIQPTNVCAQVKYSCCYITVDSENACVGKWNLINSKKP
jgi:hypothetical protein